jgi:hypothetical protein
VFGLRLMKLPIKCPYCNDIMSTVFEGEYVTSKDCILTPSHYIKLLAYNSNQEVFNIKIRIDNKKNLLSHAYWECDYKRLFIGRTRSDDISLPWIEPTLSIYPQLVQRIKLLILFS